jgi:hypothetical protein
MNHPQPRADPDFLSSMQVVRCFCASKMQTEIALSTTEVEYIALSTALRNCNFLMELVFRMKIEGVDMEAITPTLHCRAFKDNSRTVELATVHKT